MLFSILIQKWLIKSAITARRTHARAVVTNARAKVMVAAVNQKIKINQKIKKTTRTRTRISQKIKTNQRTARARAKTRTRTARARAKTNQKIKINQKMKINQRISNGLWVLLVRAALMCVNFPIQSVIPLLRASSLQMMLLARLSKRLVISARNFIHHGIMPARHSLLGVQVMIVLL
jgi:hypothetical protein